MLQQECKCAYGGKIESSHKEMKQNQKLIRVWVYDGCKITIVVFRVIESSSLVDYYEFTNYTYK
jgi:hypothetical protein